MNIGIKTNGRKFERKTDYIEILLFRPDVDIDNL